MNFVELQEYIAQKKDIGFSILPTQTEKSPRWAVERDELMQHYEGRASKVLEKAFPNEEEVIMNYRKDISQPYTRGILLKSIDEIWRMFASSRYSVEIQNKDFEKYVYDPNWDGLTMIQWVMRVGYACRIVDPNGYIAVLPYGPGLTNSNEKVEVYLNIVSSQDILDETNTLLAWKEGKSELGAAKIVHYLTDEVYAISRTVKDGERVLELVYTHEAMRLPAVKLGGRTIIEIENGKPKSRQISDFAHALPTMNSLSVVDSQYISVTLSTCFPYKFIQGVPCPGCMGTGKSSHVDALGNQAISNCISCNGGGQVFPISPLKGLFLSPAPPGVTPDERTAMANKKPIEFASPDISTIQFLADRRDKLKTELSEILDVNRSQTFAQSGVSKEKDRETMYIQISRIAEYWFNVMLDGILEVSQIYREPIDANRGEINVIAPVSFDIKDESDLLAEFVELHANAPAIIRYPAFDDYVRKRFANNQPLSRAMSLAVQYAPLSIANQAELFGKPPEDIVKATWAMPLILGILKETNGFKNAKNEQMTDEEILSDLDKRMTGPIAAIPTPVAQSLADQLVNGNFNVST